MKLIFEGWRRYLGEDKKVLKEGYSETEDEDRTRDALTAVKMAVSEKLADDEGMSWVLDDEDWADIDPWDTTPEKFIGAINNVLDMNLGTSIEGLGIDTKGIIQQTLQRGGR